MEADGVSVSELKSRLSSTYELNNLDYAMIAVNEEYSQEDTVVKSGDVVAFYSACERGMR